jgi:PAH dioxygenase large subunit
MDLPLHIAKKFIVSRILLCYMPTEEAAVGGPTQSDTSTASSVDEFVESQRDAVRDGRVISKIYNDEDIFESERERIFGQCWVFVGAESEVPDAGDYASRYIGTDPFILSRAENGEVRVLFNSCRHKGAKVCRTEQGNTSHFRCPFHGWTYKNDGDLIGVPNRKLLHGDSNLAEEKQLMEAPRVGSYNGLIFASLNEDAPALEEYLGEAKWYLDLITKGFSGGLEVVAEPHRVEIESDWKIGAEGFAGDAHHTEVTHQSLLKTGLARPEAVRYNEAGKEIVDRVNVSHAGPSAWTTRVNKKEPAMCMGHDEEYMTGDELTDDQYEALSRMMILVGTVFPNLSIILTPDTGEPDEVGRTASIRQWQPLGPGRAELWSWVIAPADAPQSYKEDTYKSTTATFSPAGNYEQDDIAVWETISDAAGSEFVTKEEFKLDYQGGWGSIGGVSEKDDWYGPGTAWDDVVTEISSLSFHANWVKKMQNDEEWASYPEDHNVGSDGQ